MSFIQRRWLVHLSNSSITSPMFSARKLQLKNNDCMTLVISMAVISLFLTMREVIATEVTTSDATGTKRALMIGINSYRAVPKLQGSLNDIETIKQVLVTR